MEGDSKAGNTVFDREEPFAGGDSEADEIASARHDLLLHLAVTIAIFGGEARKVPEAGPAFAGLAVPEHDAIAPADDDGDFRHVFIDFSLRRTRDFCDQVLLIRLTESGDRAAVALG